MAKAKAKTRVKPRANNRRIKKRVSILTSEKIEYVDWKNAELLQKFMSDRAKIRSRRVTGNSEQQQKLVADAIKVAREMALVPYADVVATQRHPKDRRHPQQGSTDASTSDVDQPQSGGQNDGQRGLQRGERGRPAQGHVQDGKHRNSNERHFGRTRFESKQL